MSEETADQAPPAASGHEPADRPHGSGLVWLTVGLGLAAVCLGLWGNSRADDLSATDNVYRTVQLFYVNSIPDQGVPWQLNVARFLAPAALLAAVLATVLALTRERLRRWFLWRFGRGHLLVVGLGDRGSRVARAARQTRRSGAAIRFGELSPDLARNSALRNWIQGKVIGHVVALERDAEAAATLRKTGMTVITGDGTDAEILRRCNAEESGGIALLAGGDTVNLEILAALRRLCGSDSSSGSGIGVRVHVAVEDPALWSALHRIPMSESASPSKVRFISVPDRSARLLIDAARQGPAAERPPHRIVIWGEGPTVVHLVAQVLRAGIPDPELPASIVICGPDKDANLATLEALEPWTLERCHLLTDDGPGSWREAGLALICGLGEAEVVSVITTLRRWIGEAPAYAAVPDQDTKEALEAAAIDLTGTELISVADGLFGAKWLAAWDLEDLARARHDLYLAGELDRGATLGTDPVLQPWERLPEAIRTANRDFAVGAARVLSNFGLELAPLSGHEAGRLPLDEETVQQLAEEEHERWAEDKQAQGWSYGPIKDMDRKEHPLLIPWDQLPESEKIKDVESITGLPAMLAACGYEVVRSGRDGDEFQSPG